jgi:hypothetical protein
VALVAANNGRRTRVPPSFFVPSIVVTLVSKFAQSGKMLHAEQCVCRTGGGEVTALSGLSSRDIARGEMMRRFWQ